METTAQSSFPQYGDNLFDATQSAVERIRLDLKDFKFGNSIESSSWKKTLPAPLDKLENYPVLRTLFRKSGTEKFWRVVSSIYGVPFIVSNKPVRPSVGEILLIKNDNPDLIDNLDPNQIPGYNLEFEGILTLIVDNINPDEINNLNPQEIANISSPDYIQSRYYYVFISYPKKLPDYEQEQIIKIREDIRALCEYFMPVDRELARMVNQFP